MSRSILIVICDFLVLSLLALARFDVVDTAGQRTDQPAVREGTGGNQDMVNVLKLALESERQAREKLHADLTAAGQTVQQQQRDLEKRDQAVSQYRASLERTEGTAAALQRERAALQGERVELQQRVVATQTNLARAQKDLTLAATTAKVSQEKLAELEAELAARRREAEQMKRNLAEIEQRRAATDAERQKLAGQLQLSETEKRLVREQVQSLRGEVDAGRAEKARLQEQAKTLAQGVSALAEKSEEIKQEMRENRPIAANTLFNDFISNRVDSVLAARRNGAFGQDVTKRKEARSILATDGTNFVALLHAEDTPFQFWPVTEWEDFSGVLRRGRAEVPVAQLNFLNQDPRIAVVPLRAADARALGARIYPLAQEPFKWGEAVLVGASEGYYGECRFQLDPELPHYVRMQRGLFRRLVGNFTPSRGDLVLSRTGELLGIMVNNEYCALLKDFGPGLVLGAAELKSSRQLLSQLHQRVTRLPLKLQ